MGIVSSVFPLLQGWGGGIPWSLTPAIVRKQQESGREEGSLGFSLHLPPGAEFGVLKTRGHPRLYSLQMLKRGKSLEDLHQFGESLGAEDRAQPRRQTADREMPGIVTAPQSGARVGGRVAESRSSLRPPPQWPPSPGPHQVAPQSLLIWGWGGGRHQSSPRSSWASGLGKWFPNSGPRTTTSLEKIGLFLCHYIYFLSLFLKSSLHPASGSNSQL